VWKAAIKRKLVTCNAALDGSACRKRQVSAEFSGVARLPKPVRYFGSTLHP
jgi:hypothetical protein